MSNPSFFELIQPGEPQHLGSHVFEADEIISFARTYDPQRFHVSDEEAKASNFGKLCASGWHTAAVWMRLNVKHGHEDLFQTLGYEGPPPVFGPSPGVRNLRWLLPVYVGDEIAYSTTITGKKINSKRPGWGLMTSHSQGINQDGKLVISMDGAVTLRVD